MRVLEVKSAGTVGTVGVEVGALVDLDARLAIVRNGAVWELPDGSTERAASGSDVLEGIGAFASLTGFTVEDTVGIVAAVDGELAMTHILPPTLLNANAPTETSINLSWTASITPGVTGYRIERAINPEEGEPEWETDQTVGIVTSAVSTELDHSTDYIFRVFALIGAKESGPSNTDTEETLVPE